MLDNIHIVQGRSSQPSSITHEYAHAVSEHWAFWNNYRPIDENFANYGSCKSRHTSIYNYWGTNINLTVPGDTGHHWNFQLAGVWWELMTQEVYDTLRKGIYSAREFYDEYPGTPDANIKKKFRQHGVPTKGWPPAGPGDPDVFLDHFSDYKVDTDGDGLAEYLNIDIDFDVPAAGDYYVYAFVAGNYSDSGIDTDADGLYDYLAIDVELGSSDVADYQAGVNLYDSSGNFLAYAEADVDLHSGSQFVRFDFDGRTIRACQTDGPYVLNGVFLFDEHGMPVYSNDFLSYNTSPYSYTQFE